MKLTLVMNEEQLNQLVAMLGKLPYKFAYMPLEFIGKHIVKNNKDGEELEKK